MLLMNDMQALGALIDDRLKMRGLAAYELASRLGRQPSFVSRLINGQNANLPDAAVLRQVGEIVGLSMEEMLRAAGYFDADPGDEAHTVAADDPRAALLEALAGQPDEIVRTLTASVRTLLPVLRAQVPPATKGDVINMQGKHTRGQTSSA